MARRLTKVGIGLLLAGAAYFLLWTQIYHPHHDTYHMTCVNNLKMIAGSLLNLEAVNELARPPGADYLLQVAPSLTPDQMRAFRCPLDPTPEAEHRCSYRGPDEWLAEEIRARRAPADTIVACDANGPSGDEPHHPQGVSVLRLSWRVEFIAFEDMEGYDGDPVTVGPGSPDPRFRHLVR